jgi:hypothetical protein
MSGSDRDRRARTTGTLTVSATGDLREIFGDSQGSRFRIASHPLSLSGGAGRIP